MQTEYTIHSEVKMWNVDKNNVTPCLIKLAVQVQMMFL